MGITVQCEEHRHGRVSYRWVISIFVVESRLLTLLGPRYGDDRTEKCGVIIRLFIV